MEKDPKSRKAVAGLLACAGILVSGCASMEAPRDGRAPPASRPLAAKPNHRQYFDQNRGRYYYFDQATHRYYWEDGSPRS